MIFQTISQTTGEVQLLPSSKALHVKIRISKAQDDLGGHGLLVAAMVILVGLVAMVCAQGPCLAWAASDLALPKQEHQLDESIYLYAGESVFQTRNNLQRVAVGDPEIADLKVLDEGTFLLVGVSAGRTTLMVWTEHGPETHEVIVTRRPPVDLDYVQGLLAGWGVKLSWWQEYLVVQGVVSTIDEQEAVGHLARTIWEPVIDLVRVSANEAPLADTETSVTVDDIKRALDMPEIHVRVVKDLAILEGTVEFVTERVRAGEIARQFAPEVLNLIEIAEPPLDLIPQLTESDSVVLVDELAKEQPITLQDITMLCQEWDFTLRWVGEILLLEGVEHDPNRKAAIISLLELLDVCHIDATTKGLVQIVDHSHELDALDKTLQELPGLRNVAVFHKGKRLIIEGDVDNPAQAALAEALAEDCAKSLGLEVFSLLEVPKEKERVPARSIQNQMGIPGLVVRWVGEDLVLQGTLSPNEHKAALALANQYSLRVIDLIEESGLTPLTLAEISSLLDAKDISVESVGNTVILHGEVASKEQRQRAMALASAFGYPVVDAMVLPILDEEPIKEPEISSIETAIGLDQVRVKLVNGSIMLEGTVKTAMDKTRASLVAATFGEVIDLIEVDLDHMEVGAPKDETDNWRALLEEAENFGARLYTVGQSVVLEGTVSAQDASYLKALMEVEFPYWVNRLDISEPPPEPLPALSEVKLLIDNPAIHCTYVNDVLVIQGKVRSDDEIWRAEALASVFGVPVHNLLVVEEATRDQVWVDVCMLEISRSAGKEVGLDWQLGLGNREMDHVSLSIYEVDQWSNQPRTNSHTFGIVVGPLWARSKLLHLMQSGDARILASPSLLAEDGQVAEFLAGGEIPVPTEGGIEWKPYGVGLKVQPTLRDDGDIHLQVEPEVSSLDWDNAVQLEDSLIPGIRTRRWKTQAAIEPGKALVIGGLLAKEDTRRDKQVPGLGQLPILGTLFRSESLSDQRTDLVVIVSPRLLQEGDPLWTDALLSQ